MVVERSFPGGLFQMSGAATRNFFGRAQFLFTEQTLLLLAKRNFETSDTLIQTSLKYVGLVPESEAVNVILNSNRCGAGSQSVEDVCMAGVM